MDERSTIVKDGGAEYEIHLTAKTTKEIAGRYRGLDNMDDKHMKSENFEIALYEIAWLIAFCAIGLASFITLSILMGKSRS